MLLPYIQFEESVEGTAPIRTNIRNRIGIVGEFSKGPANVATNIAGYSDFVNRFGIDTKNGSLAFQTAWDQGAQDFIVVRVLGREQLASQKVAVAASPNLLVDTRALIDLYYIGDPVPTSINRISDAGVSTSGAYTGTSGRYHFRVIRRIATNPIYTVVSLPNPARGVLQINVAGMIIGDDGSYIADGDDILSTEGLTAEWIDLEVGDRFGQIELSNNRLRYRAAGGLTAIQADTFTLSQSSSSGPASQATVNIPATPGVTSIALTTGTGSSNPLAPLVERAGRIQIAYIFAESPIEPAPIDALEEAGNITSAQWAAASDIGSVSTSTSGFLLVAPTANVTVTNANLNGMVLGFLLAGNLTVNDQWAVRVIEDERAIDLVAGETRTSIISKFVSALSNKGIFGTLESLQEAGNTLIRFSLSDRLVSESEASSKFRLTITLRERANNAIVNGVFVVSNGGAFTGAVKGPRFAYRDYFADNSGQTPLLRVQSLYQGSKGNSISVSITPKSTGVFDVEVIDNNVELLNPGLTREIYNNVSFIDSAADGSLTAFNNSKLVRAFFLPKLFFRVTDVSSFILQTPQFAGTPQSNGTYTYSGVVNAGLALPFNLLEGNDGPPVTDSDYIQALELLESQPVHIVIASGKTSSAIRSALIRHCENADEIEGLRIAVLSASRSLVPDFASQDSSGLQSRRAVMVAGWTNYFRYPDLPAFSVAPDGYYAGKIAATRYYAGPHSRRTAGFITGVTAVDTVSYSSRSSLQVYTDARMEILSVDPANQAYVFSNGRTLSSDPLWDKISIRRTYDVVRMDLHELIQFYRSEPNTPLLARQLLSAVNAYMADKQRNGEIYSFRSATVSSSEDPMVNLVSGRLRIVIPFLPNYAADYITITLFRDTQSGNVSSGI